MGRHPGVSPWAAFWGQCVGQRAFPGHRQGDRHRTKAEVKDRDMRRHRRMQRFTGGQAAASKAQTVPSPASSSWYLSSSHKTIAAFNSRATTAGRVRRPLCPTAGSNRRGSNATALIHGSTLAHLQSFINLSSTGLSCAQSMTDRALAPEHSTLFLQKSILSLELAFCSRDDQA